jgi:hypothetical protein
MTLIVAGYDHDPRELVAIPEVRSLLRAMETSWPQWAYFFNQVDDSIKLLLSCVAGSRFLGRGAVEMDADLVAAALGRAFGGMNMVFDRFGFLEDELEKMCNGLVEVLEQAGKTRGVKRAPNPSGVRSPRFTWSTCVLDEQGFELEVDEDLPGKEEVDPKQPVEGHALQLGDGHGEVPDVAVTGFHTLELLHPAERDLPVACRDKATAWLQTAPRPC